MDWRNNPASQAELPCKLRHVAPATREVFKEANVRREKWLLGLACTDQERVRCIPMFRHIDLNRGNTCRGSCENAARLYLSLRVILPKEKEGRARAQCLHDGEYFSDQCRLVGNLGDLIDCIENLVTAQRFVLSSRLRHRIANELLNGWLYLLMRLSFQEAPDAWLIRQEYLSNAHIVLPARHGVFFALEYHTSSPLPVLQFHCFKTHRQCPDFVSKL